MRDRADDRRFAKCCEVLGLGLRAVELETRGARSNAERRAVPVLHEKRLERRCVFLALSLVRAFVRLIVAAARASSTPTRIPRLHGRRRAC